MYRFIFWLKAFATAFITNAHYADIWPIPALAHGGHLGNCLFFLVSGFCLYHIKDRFPKWYVKRAVRIYPALWIIIGMDLLVGRIQLGSVGAVFRCCIYPTWYHFITSIMLLYIAYYCVRWLQGKHNISSKRIVIGFALVSLVWYVGLFDKSEYHIDGGEEARVQFFMSMLLGMFLREKYDRITPKIGTLHVFVPLFSFLAYFLMKLIIPRQSALYCLQGLIPVALVSLVFTVSVLAIKLEKHGSFNRIPEWMNRGSSFLSGITLEIYLGQVLILHLFQDFPFPIDFILVTTLIIAYAWIVHKCASWFSNKVIKLLRL